MCSESRYFISEWEFKGSVPYCPWISVAIHVFAWKVHPRLHFRHLRMPELFLSTLFDHDDPFKGSVQRFQLFFSHYHHRRHSSRLQGVFQSTGCLAWLRVFRRVVRLPDRVHFEEPLVRISIVAGLPKESFCIHCGPRMVFSVIFWYISTTWPRHGQVLHKDMLSTLEHNDNFGINAGTASVHQACADQASD